ncbi:MAG: hypothetical protein ACK4OP_04965 [Gemmobacter sp.]
MRVPAPTGHAGPRAARDIKAAVFFSETIAKAAKPADCGGFSTTPRFQGRQRHESLSPTGGRIGELLPPLKLLVVRFIVIGTLRVRRGTLRRRIVAS